MEETLQDMIRLIKKLTAANASNLLVTSDHGFLYQNRAIDESDFSGDEVKEQILYRDRRFVLGKGLVESPALHKFTSEQLGLSESLKFRFPNRSTACASRAPAVALCMAELRCKRW